MKLRISISTVWLWVGIVMAILGLSGVAFFDDGFRHSTIDEMMKYYPGWYMVIMNLILTPFIEEFAFRSWTIGKRWVNIVCYILLVAIVLFSNSNLLRLDSFFLLPIGYFLLFYKKNIYLRTICLILSFNLLYGVMCFANAETLFQQISYFIFVTGFGFVLTYISIKYKWIYGLLIHFLFSGINIFIDRDRYLDTSYDYIQKQTNNIKMDLVKEPFLNLEVGNVWVRKNGELQLENISVQEAIKKFTQEFDGKYLYKFQNNDFSIKYSGNIQILNTDSSEASLLEIVRICDIYSDTVTMNVVKVNYDDVPNTKNYAEGNTDLAANYISIYEFVDVYNVNMKDNEFLLVDDKAKEVFVSKDLLKTKHQGSYSKSAAYLIDLGFKLEKDTTATVVILK